MEKRFTIEFSEKQLDILTRCVEDIHRFLCGQMELSNTMTRFLHETSFNKRRYAMGMLRSMIDIVHPELASKNSEYDYAGTGAKPDKKDYIANTYQIYRTLYHFLAKSKEWHNETNVYNEPALPVSGVEQPYLVNMIRVLDVEETWFDGRLFVYNDRGSYEFDPINDMFSDEEFKKLKNDFVKNGYGYSIYKRKGGKFEVEITRYGNKHDSNLCNTREDAVAFIIKTISKNENHQQD